MNQENVLIPRFVRWQFFPSENDSGKHGMGLWSQNRRSESQSLDLLSYSESCHYRSTFWHDVRSIGLYSRSSRFSFEKRVQPSMKKRSLMSTYPKQFEKKTNVCLNHLTFTGAEISQSGGPQEAQRGCLTWQFLGLKSDELCKTARIMRIICLKKWPFWGWKAVCFLPACFCLLLRNLAIPLLTYWDVQLVTLYAWPDTAPKTDTRDLLHRFPSIPIVVSTPPSGLGVFLQGKHPTESDLQPQKLALQEAAGPSEEIGSGSTTKHVVSLILLFRWRVLVGNL